MYLTVDSLIDKNNIIIGVNTIILRKGNIKPCKCDKMYMNQGLIEDKLYQLVDQFNERKINHRYFFLHYLTIDIHFMMGAEGLVRYYLLAACF